MDNVYAPPMAEVSDAPASRTQPEFFVVAPFKLLLMFFGTLGLYQLYWSYMHWTRYRRLHDVPMWPVMRAVFSIFFAHSLNREIDRRAAPAGHRWAPGALATVYVVATLATAVCDRLSWNDVGSPVTDVLSLLLLLPLGLTLWRVQRAANAACADPGGAANRHLTWANFVWLAVGLLLWALVALGLVMELAGDPAAFD